MKTCKKCGETKSIEEFPNDKSRPDGKYPYCKACNKKRVAAWRNTSHGEQKIKEWRDAHPDYWREWGQTAAGKVSRRKWLDANKEKRRTYEQSPRGKKARRKAQHKYRLAHKEQIRQKYHDNKGRYAVQQHAYYLKNTEKIKARVRQWRRENPDKRRLYKERRKAALNQLAYRLTDEDKARLYDEQNGRCAYCGITLHDDFTIDHYIPISQGGDDTPENVFIACSTCNCSKHARLPEFWAEVRGW